MVERGGPQTILWRMRIACWKTKTTHTHTHTHTHTRTRTHTHTPTNTLAHTLSRYEIIHAFQLHQWVHELTSLLGYT